MDKPIKKQGDVLPMPYRPSEEPKSTPQDWINGERDTERKYFLDRKRKELAKRKAYIIKGQNSQTAAGSNGARIESLSNLASSSTKGMRL